jgi:hypothetical protein
MLMQSRQSPSSRSDNIADKLRGGAHLAMATEVHPASSPPPDRPITAHA